MGRLILIKHSLPEIDSDRPAHMWKLSPVGEQRASSMAVTVGAMKPGSLHASAEAKADETAAFITGTTGLMLNIDPRFNEHERSEAGFLEKDDFEAKVSQALLKPNEPVFGSETIAEAVARFEEGLHDAERFSPPGDMVIVSHGTVISGYVASKTGADPVELWHQLGLPGLICLNWPNPDRIELCQNFE